MGYRDRKPTIKTEMRYFLGIFTCHLDPLLPLYIYRHVIHMYAMEIH